MTILYGASSFLWLSPCCCCSATSAAYGRTPAVCWSCSLSAHSALIVGAFLAYYLLREPFGDAQGLAKVASMMTGSYIGGGVNFAAMASQYAAGDDLTAAATVADNLLMAAYFFVLIACAGSKFFRKHFPSSAHRRGRGGRLQGSCADAGCCVLEPQGHLPEGHCV